MRVCACMWSDAPRSLSWTPAPLPPFPLQNGKDAIGAMLLLFNICVVAFFIWTIVNEVIIALIWAIDDGVRRLALVLFYLVQYGDRQACLIRCIKADLHYV